MNTRGELRRGRRSRWYDAGLVLGGIDLMIQRIGRATRDMGFVRRRRLAGSAVVSLVQTHRRFLLTVLLLVASSLCRVAGAGAALSPIVIGARRVGTHGFVSILQQAAERAPAPGGSGQEARPLDRAESIPSGGDYILEPTDVIDVHIEDAPELSKKFIVGSDGTIPMVYLKTILVSGKTCQEVERTIADGLRGRYLRDPHVTVTVLQANSRSYYIQGAVRVPGIYVVAGHPTVMKLSTIVGRRAENP